MIMLENINQSSQTAINQQWHRLRLTAADLIFDGDICVPCEEPLETRGVAFPRGDYTGSIAVGIHVIEASFGLN